MNKSLVTTLLGLSLSGCAFFQTVATVPLEEVIDNLESELSRISLASTSDLLSLNTVRKARAVAYIRSRQCAYGSANPLFLSPDPDLSLALKGTYSQNGGFKVTGVPVAPTGEISASMAAGSENTLNLKVRLVSLSGVPREYLRVTGNFLGTPNIPDELKKEFTKSLPDTYAILVREIRAIQDSFNVTDCSPQSIRQSGQAMPR